MSPPIKCRLRALRRGWCLSQQDLANLLPGCGRNRIQRIENGGGRLSATEMAACGLIFGAKAHDIFPHLYESVSEAVMQNAYRLHQKYEHRTTPKAKRRLQLLEHIKGRAIVSTNQN